MLFGLSEFKSKFFVFTIKLKTDFKVRLDKLNLKKLFRFISGFFAALGMTGGRIFRIGFFAGFGLSRCG